MQNAPDIMAQITNSRKTEYLIAVGVGAAALAVYGATLAPTVLFADGGEFQFVPWLPGIAHPTGYPLYVLMGWLFSHAFPVGEVAWRMNLFSAVTGAAAVAVVYLLAKEMVARIFPAGSTVAQRVAAVVGAFSFAFGQAFWSQAIIAEVYSLHALFVALIFWLTVRCFPTDAPASHGFTFRHGKWLALVMGLSLAHHRTAVLMIPAVLLALWLSGWRRISLPDATKLLALGASPTVLYLYLPLIAPFVPYTELRLSDTRTLVLYQNSVAGFFTHIMGGVFNADVRPSAIGVSRLAESFGFLRQQFGWMGIGLAAVGVFQLRKHIPLLALTGGGILAFWAFNLVYFIGDIFVLFIPCWLIVSLWVATGAFSIANRLAAALVARKRARVAEGPVFGGAFARLDVRMRHLTQLLVVSVALLLPLILLVTRYSSVNQRPNIIARDAWQEILSADLPENAILLSNDRNEIMPLWYYQFVEKKRTDLLGIFPLITPAPDMQNVGRVLDAAFAAGRPVIFIKPMDGLSLKADMTPLPPLPHAQLFRAEKANLSPTVSLSLTVGGGLRVTGYTLTHGAGSLVVDVFWETDAPLGDDLTSFVHVVGADGTGITQSDHRPGGVFYPTSLWQPGETLRDRHTLTLPDALPPGDYSLVVGMYRQPQPGVVELVGEVTLTIINEQ